MCFLPLLSRVADKCQWGEGLCLVHAHIPAPRAESGTPEAVNNYLLTAGCLHLHCKVAFPLYWLLTVCHGRGVMTLSPLEFSDSFLNGHVS